MKPHLPKVIISALLAAQVAVGVTVSDTTELEWTALTITTPANGTLTTGNSVIDWSEETGNLTDSWKLSFTLDPSRLEYCYLFGTKADGSGAAGYTLTITENGTISLNENKNTSVITAGAYTADDSAVAITLQFVRYVDGIGNDAGGEFTLSVGSKSGSYTVEDLTNTILTKGSDNNLWTNGGGETFSGIAVSHSGLVISDRVYFWNGASGSNWTDACWQHKEMQENGALTELKENAYVVFASDEETEQLVNLSTGCAATRFAVQSGDWALAGGGELTVAEDFVLKDSSSLTIQEDTRLVISGAATIGSEAQLTLEKGGTLELKGGVRDDGYVDDVWLLSEDYTPLLQTVTGDGDIVISEDVSFVGSKDSGSPVSMQTTGSLIVQKAATFYLGAYKADCPLYADASSLSSIRLEDGSTLWYRAGESTLQKVQTSGSEPSVLHIQALDGFSSKEGEDAKLIIHELVLDADMRIEGGNNAALAVNKLSGTGNLSLVGSENTNGPHLVELSIGNSFSGTISLADKRNTEFALTLTNGASATIQGIAGNGIGQYTQLKTTLEDGTHLHVAGNSASVVKWEEFVITHGSSATLSADEGVQLNVREISGGHLSIGAEVGSVSLTGGTITNNASLSLYGNITISGELDSYESYGSGNPIGYSMNDGTVNGFKLVAGKQYYLSMGGSNSLATNTAALNITTTESLTGDTAYLSVVEATEEKQAGIVFSLDPTYSAEFYVQEGRVDQSSLLADETCGVTATTHYIISGGTLSLSQNVGTNLLTYESGSVELQSGSTLSINTAAESNAALLMNSSGAGSVQVSQNIALADDYTANISGELNISQATVAQGKADLESFSGIRLSNGATLSYGNREQSYTNLTVNSGTQNLTYTAAGDETRAATLSIGKLSGSGELHLTATDKLTLSLEDTQDFEGTLLMNSNHISLNLAENAGITAWYQETANGELNLLNVSAGNTIGLRVVNGFLTSGNIVANLKLQNYSGSAALWISDKDENGEITLTGSISGGGNMGLAAADKSISMSITGDTSGWNGNIQFHGNEHQLTFTENAVSIRNSKIFTANGGTGYVELRHESEATVEAALDGALHVTVSNSSEEGTSFTNSVDISSLSVEADSRVEVTHSTVSVDAVDNAGTLSFTGTQSLNLTDLSLADGSVLSVGSGVATIAAESADTFTGVTVSGTAVLEGGSTINGSLDLCEADSLELNNMDEAININGDLSLVLGDLPSLSGNYTEMLEDLIDGQHLDLFRVTGSITLNGLGLADGYSEDAGSVIAAIEQGHYTLGYKASATGGGGTLYLSSASAPAVPEPTTTALSLLALAALAARRRRK